MIAYLVGEITQTYDEYTVLEVGGIGYEILVCADYKLSGHQKIYIYENIKEEIHDLYGFVTLTDKQIFKKLITVNGVGPKAACQMITMYGANQLASYIIQGNNQAITKINGIGAKIANRVILELKDKLSDYFEPVVFHLNTDLTTSVSNVAKYEATEGLVALGYSNTEATKAVTAIYNDNDTSEQLIKKALELMALIVD
ncbi:MAG: Holliday junction DNA helicase RuvA [Epulopiscium sp. Nele67-Bin001]|nr:MAG: Holliday junction DNA helicase RuvA [Epulopiscium sp. Nuni2H_MBin001]OON93106.1 MAG: Holliday junction DNA helicase RuvA [Epulopiscium sp. Nele67-Bin001]